MKKRLDKKPSWLIDNTVVTVENLFTAQYYSGGLAVLAVVRYKDTGEKSDQKVSINIKGVSEELPKDQFVVKNYSENENLFRALIDAGWIERTDKIVELSYVTVPVCQIGKNAIVS